MSEHSTTATDLAKWDNVIRAYEEWVAADDVGEAVQWKRQITCKAEPTVEGAVGEAVAWDDLARRVSEIRRFPNPGPGKKRPDFLCQSSGVEFAVEVTNLSRERVDPYHRVA